MEEKKFLTLEDVNAYKIAFNLSNFVWYTVMAWDSFAKRTVGSQFVEAIDSISSNIAEGFGRYFKADKINFYRYSYGSINESIDWTEKSYQRKLLRETEHHYILQELNKLPKEIHSLIKLTREKLKV